MRRSGIGEEMPGYDEDEPEDYQASELREELDTCYQLLEDCKELISRVGHGEKECARMCRRIEFRLLDPVKGSLLRRRGQ